MQDKLKEANKVGCLSQSESSCMANDAEKSSAGDESNKQKNKAKNNLEDHSLTMSYTTAEEGLQGKFEGSDKEKNEKA
eukprot:11421328-Alexandrium_andersonii.AAC.1